MRNVYKGDTGIFRLALREAGFLPQSECLIFNDRRKDGTRRLKLWAANTVFKAPQKQQKALELALRDLFENCFETKILEMYFIETYPWAGKSLCIVLEK